MPLKRTKTIDVEEEVNLKTNRRESVAPRNLFTREQSFEAESNEQKLFQNACNRLRTTLPETFCHRTKIEIPDFDSDTQVDSAAEKLDIVMDEVLRKVQPLNDLNGNEKVKAMMRKLFKSTYPYIRVGLQIGLDITSAVYSTLQQATEADFRTRLRRLTRLYSLALSF